MKRKRANALLALDCDSRIGTCLGTANLDTPVFKASLCIHWVMLTEPPCPLGYKCRLKPPAPT